MNIMVSSRLSFFKLSLCLALTLCSTRCIARAPYQGCLVEEIGLKQCSKQDEGSIETCCIALNAVIREGFDCFCSLFTYSEPLLRNGFSLLSSNCYVSIPPLALCQDRALPVVFPPITPDDSELSAALGGANSANVGVLQNSMADQNSAKKLNAFGKPSDETSDGEDKPTELLYNVVFLFLLLKVLCY
ncbi:uncharacterized protein LOC125315590 [Rhodamnia argentea]|uniref:Uncharacterized protein LOC125315590 n=1 Tax=Rhodamnia argentea TaxID=178133 RepID=A0ABM3HJW6_9MYRT|nr:uncharacterized protein LOC125315590 [Rhodamnia argentea]